MSWSDIFLPSSAQTPDEAAANLERERKLYNERLAAREAAGTVTPEQATTLSDYVNSVSLDNQDAAAAAGFEEGAKEGLNNVLNAPGNLIGAVGSGLSQTVWGILKNIPWWIYLVGLGALFVWMGGLTLLRGRFARQ